METKSVLMTIGNIFPACHRPSAFTSLFLAIVLSVCLIQPASAQVPQGFNYQAIARDIDGNPILDQPLPVRITIQSDSLGGTVYWQEIHPDAASNSFGLITLILGHGVRQTASTADAFNTIDWGTGSKYIKTEIDYNGWKNMGSARLYSVPYSMVARDIGGPLKKLAVTGETASLEEALFEVKNNAGLTVFAVYNEGVRVYVDDGDAKGVKGGFAIGGLNPAKANGQEYLRVTHDSIRLYINDNPVAKGVKGGFAIGGFDLAKGTTSEYLDVISSSAPEIINPAEPRILWYPLREAFLTGKVLVENPDSIGTNSISSGYESKAIGNYSQALGYKAVARGNYSTSIGRNSLSKGVNSFAFGNLAKATAGDSYSFGAGAIASAPGSFAIGSAGVDSAGTSVGNTTASGLGSFALGFGSVSSGEGSFSYGLGNQATGPYSMSLGYLTNSTGWYATSMGHNTTSSGFYSTALGYFTTSSGIGSSAMGCGTTSAGLSSTTFGWLTEVEPGSIESSFNMGAFASGVSTKAGNYAATSFGDRTYASGHTSFATGFSTTAAGQLSATFGASTIANGIGSIATGYSTIANGVASLTMGYGTVADGDGSAALGMETVARPYASLVLGQYNVISGTPNIWFSWEPIFIIGNGISAAARSNALTVYKNGSADFAGSLNLNSAATGSALYVNGNQALWHDGTYFSWGYGGSYNVFADKVSVGTVNNPGTYSLYVAGTAWCSSGSWAGSDIRWKRNITDIDNTLEGIMALNPVRYDWRKDEFPEAGFEDGSQLGLIAQDVEKVFPELVRSDDAGYKAVSYEKLSVILLEGLQEQQRLIEDQSKENNRLREEVQSLRERMERMEAILLTSGNK